MPDTSQVDIQEVPGNGFPKKIRTTLNKVVKLIKRPWEITFNNERKNEVLNTGEKVVLNLATITVDMCKNGQPRQAKLVGTLNPPPTP